VYILSTLIEESADPLHSRYASTEGCRRRHCCETVCCEIRNRIYEKKREIKTLNSINAVPIASNCIRINHDHCWKTCIVSLPEFPSALRSSNFLVFFRKYDSRSRSNCLYAWCHSLLDRCLNSTAEKEQRHKFRAVHIIHKKPCVVWTSSLLSVRSITMATRVVIVVSAYPRARLVWMALYASL